MAVLEDGLVGCDACRAAVAESEEAALGDGWAREKVGIGGTGVIVVNHICPDCLADAVGHH